VGDGWLALPFHDVGPMPGQLREKAGRDVPVTILDGDPCELGPPFACPGRQLLARLASRGQHPVDALSTTQARGDGRLNPYWATMGIRFRLRAGECAGPPDRNKERGPDA
jgi:hypothetical protein